MFFSDASAADATTVPNAPATITTTGTTTPATVENAGDPTIIGMAMPLVAVIAVMYFIIIRPQQKRLREHDALVKSLGRGDKIVTAGGIVGIIHKVDDDIIVLEVAPDVKIRVVRDTISHVVTKTGIANDNKSADGQGK